MRIYYFLIILKLLHVSVAFRGIFREVLLLRYITRATKPMYKHKILSFKYVIHIFPPPPDVATARGGPWPPLQYASKLLDSLLYLSIRLHPSFSGPWTRHPAISFLVFLFVLLHTAFHTNVFFCDCSVFHSFYVTKPSYSSTFNKPNNIFSFDYDF